MKLRKMLTVLAALALSLPVAAQTAAEPSVAEPLVLSTRFDPPLGKVLVYRVTQERTKAGKTESTAITQEVSYRRESDGFVMTVRPISTTSGAQTIDLKAPDARIPLTLRPFLEAVDLDLDADGTILRVRNWDDFKARLQTSIPALLTSIEPDAKKRAQTEPAIRQFLARYFAVGPESAPQLMLKGWPDLLGVMGASGTEGEDQFLETQVTTPFSAEPIRNEVTIRLSQLDAGNALRIDVNSRPDPEAFRQLVHTLVDSLATAAPANQPFDREEMERELAALDLSMTMEVEIDARTGLVRRGMMVRHVAMNEGSGTNRIIVEAQ